MNDINEMLKEAPQLTLEPVIEGAPQFPAEQAKKETAVADTEEEMKLELTPEEQKMVDDFAGQIDLRNTQMVMQYGAGCQKKIADFSETALDSVRTKDMGEVGEMLTKVVAELKSIEDGEEEKGFFGIFRKNANKLSNMKARYDKAEVNVEKISTALEQHQVTLLKDVAMLDKMYELNLNYFKELSMYILAGKQKLKEAQEVELPALVEKAERSKLPEDTQAARDFSEMCNRFEKKIHDLELTRMVSLQMAPQIRLIQNNDTVMSDKIQSTLVNTIPLWKSQMVIAIGLNHSTDAAKAQHEVSEMTNELLKKNAENLKTATIETAREGERGIVDIETLQSTNQTLISTLDEVLKIQDEGREKRRNAEAELQKIEKEMREKLLEVSSRSKA
ncbi:MAG: toxic anion resistance protein [Acetatifactor sp.]